MKKFFKNFAFTSNILKKSCVSNLSIANSGLIQSKNLINLMTCSFATKMRGTVTKNKKDSAGRRLGLKKTDGQEVFKNDILIRQRGFKYKPGENVHYGRDHTLVASKEGILKFTTLPWSNLKKVVVNVLEKEIPNRYIPAPTPFMYHPSLYPEEAKNNYKGDKLEVKNPGKYIKGNKLLKNRLEYSSMKENYLLGVEQNKANNIINDTNFTNENNIEVLNDTNEDIQLLAKRSKNILFGHRKNKFQFALDDLVNDHLEKNYREYDKKYNNLINLPIKVKEIKKANTLKDEKEEKDEKAEKEKIENKSKKQVKTNKKSLKMSKKNDKKSKKSKQIKSEAIQNSEVINNEDNTNTNTTEKNNEQINMNENIDMNASEQLTNEDSNQNIDAKIVSNDKDRKKLEKRHKKSLKKVHLEIKEQDLLNKMNKSLMSTYLSMKSQLLGMYLNSEPTAEEFSKKLEIYSSNKFYKSKQKVIRKMLHILNTEDLNKFLFKSNIKKLNSISFELIQIINGFKILKLHNENVDIFKNDLYNFDKGISKKYNTLHDLNNINTKNLSISLKYDVKKCLNKCRSFFLFKYGFVINESVDINKEYMNLEMLLSKISGRLNFKKHNLTRLRSNILKVRTRRNIAIQKIVNGHKLIKRKDIIIIKDLKPNKFRVKSNGIKKSKIETLRKKNIRKYYRRKALKIKSEENKKKRLEQKAQLLKEKKEEKEKKKMEKKEKKESKNLESKELNEKNQKEAKNQEIKRTSNPDSKVGNKTNKINNSKTSNNQNQKDKNKTKLKVKHPLKTKSNTKFKKNSLNKQKVNSANTKKNNKTLKSPSKIKNVGNKEIKNSNDVNKSEEKIVKKPLQSKSLKPKSKSKSKSPLIKNKIEQQSENQNTQINFDQNELNKSKNVKI